MSSEKKHTSRKVLASVLLLFLVLLASGCTVGRLHASLMDMNNAEDQRFTSEDGEDLPPKTAAQLMLQWRF